MENLPKAEISSNIIRIQFESMLEIFCCFVSFSCICQQSGEVNARPEVLSVLQEALFEERDCLLEILLFLINAP